jgi:hypothetical protein
MIFLHPKYGNSLVGSDDSFEIDAGLLFLEGSGADQVTRLGCFSALHWALPLYWLIL